SQRIRIVGITHFPALGVDTSRTDQCESATKCHGAVGDAIPDRTVRRAHSATQRSNDPGTCDSFLLWFRAFLNVAVNQLRRNRDRKSTRLNSSHVSISYAVF